MVESEIDACMKLYQKKGQLESIPMARRTKRQKTNLKQVRSELTTRCSQLSQQIDVQRFVLFPFGFLGVFLLGLLLFIPVWLVFWLVDLSIGWQLLIVGAIWLLILILYYTIGRRRL